MTGDIGTRSRVPVLLVLIGLLLAAIAGASIFTSRDAPTGGAAAAPAPAPTALDELIYGAQESLRRNPDDAPMWARLGAGYVEQARVTADPSYYGRAQGALDRSLEVTPDGNGEALIGLGRGSRATATADLVPATHRCQDHQLRW